MSVSSCCTNSHWTAANSGAGGDAAGCWPEAAGNLGGAFARVSGEAWPAAHAVLAACRPARSPVVPLSSRDIGAAQPLSCLTSADSVGQAWGDWHGGLTKGAALNVRSCSAMLRLASCSDWHRSCAMLCALARRLAANGDLTADASLVVLKVGQGCCEIIRAQWTWSGPSHACARPAQADAGGKCLQIWRLYHPLWILLDVELSHRRVADATSPETIAFRSTDRYKKTCRCWPPPAA